VESRTDSHRLAGLFPDAPATIRLLIDAGADLNGRPGYSDQTPAEAAADPGTQRDNLITWLHDRQQAT
jgi:hypothetical protein